MGDPVPGRLACLSHCVFRLRHAGGPDGREILPGPGLWSADAVPGRGHRRAMSPQPDRPAGGVAHCDGLAGIAGAVRVDVRLEPVRGFRAFWVDPGLLDAVDPAEHSQRRTPPGFPGLWVVARRLAVAPRAGAPPGTGSIRRYPGL